MHIYTALQIGDDHRNHCEDYFFVDHLEARYLVCAVMGGCTTGTDSYFAATLTGKLLRKIMRERQSFQLKKAHAFSGTAEELLRYVLIELMMELKTVHNRLLLDNDELLTTLVLLVMDQQANNGMLLAIGDGVVCIDGNITVFDHDDKPDYLGFHLAEDLPAWYDSLDQKIHVDAPNDLSIATGGLRMFTRPATGCGPGIDPVAFLTIDRQGKEHRDMLDRKLKTLEHQFGLKPGDDLAMIRLLR